MISLPPPFPSTTKLRQRERKMKRGCEEEGYNKVKIIIAIRERMYENRFRGEGRKLTRPCVGSKLGLQTFAHVSLLRGREEERKG